MLHYVVTYGLYSFVMVAQHVKLISENTTTNEAINKWRCVRVVYRSTPPRPPPAKCASFSINQMRGVAPLLSAAALRPRPCVAHAPPPPPLALRYKHFIAADGSQINPFDLGVLGNCTQAFLGTPDLAVKQQQQLRSRQCDSAAVMNMA